MLNLEKRIAALESMQGTGLEALTDDELEARIAAFGVEVDTAEELENCIAKLKAELLGKQEHHHAEH